MKIAIPEISNIFVISESKVNTLIIENQRLLVSVLSDINDQLNGNEGLVVLSENDHILKLSKYCELISQFVPFELNTKLLASKLVSALEKRGVSADHYEETQKLLCMMENYLYSLSLYLTGDISFSKINLSSIIKSVGAGFTEEYDNLAEKIIEYMELVREYDNDKLFITLNIRDYIGDVNVNEKVYHSLLN